MPVEIIVALITVVPVVLMGVANFILNLRIHAVSQRNTGISLQNNAAISVVKKQTDGLVEAALAKSLAEGVTQGHREAVENAAAVKTSE